MGDTLSYLDNLLSIFSRESLSESKLKVVKNVMLLNIRN